MSNPMFATMIAPTADPCDGCMADCIGPMQPCVGHTGLCMDAPTTARPLGAVVVRGEDDDLIPF